MQKQLERRNCMKEPKTKIAKCIYWKRKANSLEIKLKEELMKNEPLKNELAETNKKLIILYEKRSDTDKTIKELKSRISDLEEIVNKKKKVK